MAVKEILKFYDGYISKLCLRPFYHSESGKIIMQVDEELKGEIHTDMMKAILKFEIGVKKSGDTQFRVISLSSFTVISRLIQSW